VKRKDKLRICVGYNFYEVLGLLKEHEIHVKREYEKRNVRL
jgi:hypothetical protein